MVLTALNMAGGAAYLAEMAHKNSSAFLGLVGRVLPLQVHAKIEQDVRQMSEAELLAIIAEDERTRSEQIGEPDSTVH